MRLVVFLFLAAVGFAFASPDADWNAVVALDAGPGSKPKNIEEARALAKKHLHRQETLVSEFLEKNPSDPRSHEARMRLASLLAAIGKMDSRQSQVDESMRLLQALEKDPSAPREVRAEAGFRRVSLLMQSLQGQENERRRDIVAAARNFQNRHPGDRRAEGAGSVLCLQEISGEPAEVPLDGRWRDLLSGLIHSGSAALPPMGAAWLTLER